MFAPGASIIVPIAATVAYYWYLRYRFLQPGKSLSLLQAVQADNEHGMSPIFSPTTSHENPKKELTIIVDEDKEETHYEFQDPALLPLPPIPKEEEMVA